MNKSIIVISSFLIMLCLGSVYSWSMFVPELINTYGLKSSETQLIFGTVIAVFTSTMIWAAKLKKLFGPRLIASLSGILFALGYTLAYYSKGNFYLLWLGIGFVAGISTGMGYLVSISIPVKWFPNKKGLITGIVSAGFGAGAIVLSFLSEHLLERNIDVLQIFLFTGISYGFLILLFAQAISEPKETGTTPSESLIRFSSNKLFYRLFIGIFGGTFTGLLIIGNLKPIGLSEGIDNAVLVFGVAIFSVANFTGRLVWGWLSDFFSNDKLIPLSLVLMASSALILGLLPLNTVSFLILALTSGFNFGANFVLFAKETIQVFGLSQYSQVYPFVFMGYGIAGIFGPTFGGWLYDVTGSFASSLVFSFAICLFIAFFYLSFRSFFGKKALLHDK